VAEVVRDHPGRFAAFAALPCQGPDAALTELDRAVTELGLCGTLINGHTHGVYLDEQRFSRLWELAQSLQVPIYIHPADPPETVTVSTIVHRVFRDALSWQAAPEMKTWTGPQLGTFLEWVKADRYGPPFTFLATTGMRGEAPGLRGTMCQPSNASPKVRRTVTEFLAQAALGFHFTSAESQTKLGATRKYRGKDVVGPGGHDVVEAGRDIGGAETPRLGADFQTECCLVRSCSG
jgi:hypothetical protein